MPGSATNRAEDTFARSIRLPKAKRSAMTFISLTSRHGATRGREIVRNSRRSRWNFTTFIRARGAISSSAEIWINYETDAENLAAKGTQGQGRIRQLFDGRRESGDVDAGVSRRAQRDADRKGRRAGGLRARLPRRHLRFVRIHDQRRRA